MSTYQFLSVFDFYNIRYDIDRYRIDTLGIEQILLK